MLASSIPSQFVSKKTTSKWFWLLSFKSVSKILVPMWVQHTVSISLWRFIRFIETGDENLRLINTHFWDSYGNHRSKNDYFPNCSGSYGHFKVMYIFVAHLAQILWRIEQKICFFNFIKFVKKTCQNLRDSIFLYEYLFSCSTNSRA